MKKLFTASVLAVLAVAFTGCDTTSRNAPGNTTLGAATIGGLSGAGIGALTGHGTKGALVGGAIGTVGGAIVGNQMEKNQQAAQQRAYYAPAPAGVGAPASGFVTPPPPPGPVSY